MKCPSGQHIRLNGKKPNCNCKSKLIKIIGKINNNVICPYCNKTLTAKSFEGGKWQCEHCGLLLTYEKFKEYYGKQRESKKMGL